MGEDLIKQGLFIIVNRCSTDCLAVFKSRQQWTEVGAEREKEEFRNGHDRLMFRVVSPKGFMFFQDINREWKNNLPRKIPDILIYVKMVKTEILGIIAEFCKAWVCTTSSRCLVCSFHPVSITTNLPVLQSVSPHPSLHHLLYFWSLLTQEGQKMGQSVGCSCH